MLSAANRRNNDHEQRLRKIFRESVTSYAVAQNIIVIKTLPGLASAACSTLDSDAYWKLLPERLPATIPHFWR